MRSGLWAAMRVTLRLFGVTVLALAVEPDPESESEFEEYQDAGVTSSTIVGFTRAETPWEDPGSLHQFEPDD